MAFPLGLTEIGFSCLFSNVLLGRMDVVAFFVYVTPITNCLLYHTRKRSRCCYEIGRRKYIVFYLPISPTICYYTDQGALLVSWRKYDRLTLGLLFSFLFHRMDYFSLLVTDYMRFNALGKKRTIPE